MPSGTKLKAPSAARLLTLQPQHLSSARARLPSEQSLAESPENCSYPSNVWPIVCVPSNVLDQPLVVRTSRAAHAEDDVTGTGSGIAAIVAAVVDAS